MNNYTWDEINNALMQRGLSPARIADILSTLVKNQKENDICKECDEPSIECKCYLK